MKITSTTKVGKVLTLDSAKGQHFEVYRKDTTCNPYSVKIKWWEGGWHRKTLAKYQNLTSCLYYLTEVVKDEE